MMIKFVYTVVVFYKRFWVQRSLWGLAAFFETNVCLLSHYNIWGISVFSDPHRLNVWKI